MIRYRVAQLSAIVTTVFAFFSPGAAWSQGALTTAVGLGYSSTGYVADLNGSTGVEILQGPQMDMEISIGLGPIFALGLEGDLTIAETGVRIEGVSEYDIAQTTELMNRDDATRLSASLYTGAAFVGLHFGDFRPSVGAGLIGMEVNTSNGRLMRSIQCPLWMVKPVDFDFAGSFNVALEYEQTFGGCEIDVSTLSMSAKVKF